MSIVVSCSCGKRFKANESLAGKKVRCPSCKGCVQIPSAGGSGSSVAMSAPVSAGKSQKSGSSSAPKVNADEALLKFEEVQRRKQADAEAEAAYREEQNKLIQSYDQIAGKATVKKETEEEKKKRKGLTEIGAKKVTIFTRIADVFGTVFGSLVAKYIIIAALCSAGVVGSIYLVRFVTGYMGKETAAQVPQEQQVKDLFKEAQVAINEGNGSMTAQFTDPIRQLSGQPVTIGGFVMPLDSRARFTHFVLTRRNSSCPFCPPNLPTEAIEVFSAQPLEYGPDEYAVNGHFQIIQESSEGLFYRITAASVQVVPA